MKFITVVAILLGISSHALAAIPLADEELDQRPSPSLRGFFDPEFIEKQEPHNPNNCPMPSQVKLTANPCYKGNRKSHMKQTICCKGDVIWVQCFVQCPSSPPADADTSDAGTPSTPAAIAAESFDSEDYDYGHDVEAVDVMAES